MACPIPTSHMTGPSYDPGKYFGFAPITVGNSGLCVPSCLFTSLNLPSDWETHLRLLAHYDEVFVCVCLCCVCVCVWRVGGGEGCVCVKISLRKKRGCCKMFGVI